jgi:HKD family nuclease
MTVVIDGTTHDNLMQRADNPTRLGINYNMEKIRVARGGVFHPKLYLFVSETSCSVALGSFNLTESGLKKNVEAGLAFTFNLEELQSDEAQLLMDLRDWLVNLFTEPNDLVSAVSPGLRSLVTEITSGPFFTAVQQRPESPRRWHLLSSLSSGIWSQVLSRLPGPISRLEVLSPFFDGDVSGFRTAAASCSDVSLYVPMRAEFPKSALAGDPDLLSALSLFSVQKVEHSIDRPIHAKLIRFTVDERQWLLVGSANFTSSGLFRDGYPRNVELSLLFEEDEGTDFFAAAGLTITPNTSLSQFNVLPPRSGQRAVQIVQRPAVESADYHSGQIHLLLNPSPAQTYAGGDISLVLGSSEPSLYPLPKQLLKHTFEPELEIDGGQLIQLRLVSHDGTQQSPLVFVNRRHHDQNLQPTLGAHVYSRCVRLGGLRGIQEAFKIAEESGREDWMWYLLTRWNLSRILAQSVDNGEEVDDDSGIPNLSARTHKRHHVRLRSNLSTLLMASDKVIRCRLSDFSRSIYTLPTSDQLGSFNQYCMPLFFEVTARFHAILKREEAKHEEDPTIIYPAYTWYKNFQRYKPLLNMIYTDLDNWHYRLAHEPELGTLDQREAFYVSVRLWIAHHSEKTRRLLDKEVPRFLPAARRWVKQACAAKID